MEQLNFKTQQLKKNAICEKHGEYISSGRMLSPEHTVWMKCPKCEQEEDQASQKAQAEIKFAREQAYFQDCLKRSLLPKRFIGKTFENFICSNQGQQQVLQITKDYATNFNHYANEGRGLILYGGIGTGKSHLASAIIQYIMKVDRLGLYITVSELIRLVRDTWNKNSESTERQIIHKFIYADLLVLDEVGRQYGTEGEESILFDILDGRYREKMPTVIMGNISTKPVYREKFKKDMNDLEFYLGERAADRLREINTAVSFSWGSYRREGAA